MKRDHVRLAIDRDSSGEMAGRRLPQTSVRADYLAEVRPRPSVPADYLAEVRTGGGSAAQEQRVLDPATNVRRLHEPTVRITNARVKLKRVRASAVADRRKRDGEVGNDAMTVRAAKAPVAEKP